MSKNGFSYYKAETDRFQDIKIKRLKKKYGCDGYAVYQYALNEIYRVDGSYIRWTEDQLFDCADYWGMNARFRGLSVCRPTIFSRSLHSSQI